MYARPQTRVKSAIPMRKTILATPIGNLAVEYEGDFVVAVRSTSAATLTARDSLAREVRRQLKAWFAGRLKTFDIPFLFPDATDFQVRVWDQITKIPFGATQTYGEIAGKIKSGPRAVGGACRCNDLLLIVPCHRVVAATGLGGFMGDRDGSLVRRKQWLLDHEQKYRHGH